MVRVGERLEHYEIVAPIAGGGMGMVYRARHVRIRREFAIKLLLPNLAANERVRARFEQEANIQAALQHPNIVRVVDFIETDTQLAIVMEFVAGPSLADTLDAAPGAWSVAEVAAMLAPVADAVAYAHSAGVVHRDLKPGNVLVEPALAGRPATPKVTDFGIARIVDSAERMTRTGAQMGTYPYMSPEQYGGSMSVDARADVFALGMMCWRMLAGGFPVDPADYGALHEMYSGARPIPSLAQVAPRTPAGLVAVVDAALALDPMRRLAGAGPLRDALRDPAGVAPRPVTGGAEHPTVLEPPFPGPPSTRPPPSPAPSTGGSASVTATGAPEPRDAPVAPPSTVGRLQRSERRSARVVGLAVAVALLGLGGGAAVATWVAGGDGRSGAAEPERSAASPDEAQPSASSASPPAEQAPQRPSAGAAPEPTTRTCRVSQECPAGQRCISSRCAPAPVYPACELNNDCHSGETCMNARCVTDPGRAAIAAWEGVIGHYIAGRRDAYFASFAPVYECYYSRANRPRERMEASRSPAFERARRTYNASNRRAIVINPNRVVVTEYFHLADGGRLFKAVTLVRRSGRWVVVAEADADSHGCFRDAGVF